MMEPPKAVIILHKNNAIDPRFYEIVAQPMYLEEVKKSFDAYLEPLELYDTESKTWSAISKDSAKKLEKIFGVKYIPVGSQDLTGRQYFQPFLQRALEKEYPVYYHNGKKFIETDSTIKDLERIVALFG